MKKSNFLLLLFSIIAGIFLAEFLVRLTWDKRQGTPGLVLLHPARIEVLAPNYKGYFSGQPLKINNLGFRDDEDYSISKDKNTVRIITIGDSVTFGDGCKFTETWPYFLKKRLEGWNGKIKWEVWNLGVPGYDSVLELRTLEELGPRFNPDLVVVGFYENDLAAWDYHSKKSQPKIFFYVRAFLKRHFYLYTKLRYCYNILRNLRADGETQCEREQRLLLRPDKELPAFDNSKFVFKHDSQGAPVPPVPVKEYVCAQEGLESMKKAIDKFKEYQATGKYNIVFFINIAPDNDPETDRFIDGPHNSMNSFFIKTLGGETPVVSSYSAFWCYRPSDVPGAAGHSLGAANMVKADVLFNFLIKKVIPDIVKNRGLPPT